MLNIPKPYLYFAYTLNCMFTLSGAGLTKGSGFWCFKRIVNTFKSLKSIVLKQQ